MSILHQVHIQLPIVFDLLSGPGNPAYSFFCISTCPMYFSLLNIRSMVEVLHSLFPCHCFDPVFFQVAFDLPYTVPLHIEIKNHLPYDLRLLWDHPQYTVWSFLYSQEIENGSA